MTGGPRARKEVAGHRRETLSCLLSNRTLAGLHCKHQRGRVSQPKESGQDFQRLLSSIASQGVKRGLPQDASCSLVSCPSFVRRAAGRQVGGRHLPPNPKGLTPAVAHTMLYVTLPERSCREGPEHFGPYPSRIPWIASAVVCQAKHARLLPYQTPQTSQPPSRWSASLLSPSRLQALKNAAGESSLNGNS